MPHLASKLPRINPYPLCDLEIGQTEHKYAPKVQCSRVYCPEGKEEADVSFGFCVVCASQGT